MSTIQVVSPGENGGGDVKETRLPRLRLEFLDGMRGIAALYVVFTHVFSAFTMDNKASLPASTQQFWSFLSYGHYAVAVFIVLSGFCLMLPVVCTPEGQIQGGFFPYLKRRARRILPPYYAALFLSLVAIAFPPMRTIGNGWWDTVLPAFTPGVLLSHVLLVHNAATSWIHKINGPFWSVATEWQIYFVFALCLLPLWRRLGMRAVLLFSFAVTELPYVLLPNFHHFERACPWYLGLFALGMAGAELCASKSGPPPAWYARVHWHYLTVLFVGVVVAQHLRWEHPAERYVDPFFGAAAICFILYCHRLKTKGALSRTAGVIRFLESPAVVGLGAFSYSLYLTHWPVLALMHLYLKRYGVSPTTQFQVLMTVGTTLCIGVAYGFHLVFERRFMAAHPASDKAVVRQ